MGRKPLPLVANCQSMSSAAPLGQWTIFNVRAMAGALYFEALRR
jgi:hypothetical protein